MPKPSPFEVHRGSHEQVTRLFVTGGGDYQSNFADQEMSIKEYRFEVTSSLDMISYEAMGMNDINEKVKFR